MSQALTELSKGEKNSGILAAVNLAVSTLIYVPFVIMATMQEQQKEQSAK